MKITVLTTTSGFSAGGFDERIKVVHNPYGKRLTENEVMDLIKIHNPVGIIAGIEPLTQQVLRSAANLKVISRCGTGLDSVDLDAAEELGITVRNTPDAPKEAVAEMTMGMILASMRNIPMLDRIVRRGLWKGPNGLLLKDSTVGIIGCGRIGSRLAELLAPYGCRIIGFDTLIKTHKNIEIMELENVIDLSDIITLHIPLTAASRNILSEDRIRRMKKGAIIINVSRGGLIDEQALFEALSNGHIFSAALDCFAEEPYSGNLINLENVVLTPHMGSSTNETREIMESQAVENLLSEFRQKHIL